MNNAVRYQVMPPLASDEYQELYEDIKVNGVLEPIHVDEDGVVIDGHHRSKIADELGIPCPVITHDDLDEAGKRSLAFTLNLKRRHLNREQRRALIAESLKSDPQLSNREHARRTGVSDKTVGSLRGEMEKSAEIPHFEKRVDPRTGNASQPASQPSRPEPPSQFGPNEEIPATTIIDTADLAELNAQTPTPEPEAKAEPQKPRRTPITESALSAVFDLDKAINRLESITKDDRFPKNKTQIRDSHISDLGRAQEALNSIIQNISE